MTLIKLPKIEDIERASYDDSKPYWYQEKIVIDWAMAVMRLPKDPNECESESAGERLRYTKLVWVYDDCKLIQTRQYINDITSSAWNEHRRYFELEKL